MGVVICFGVVFIIAAGGSLIVDAVVFCMGLDFIASCVRVEKNVECNKKLVDM